MNAPDNVRLVAYRRVLGYALRRLATCAREGDALTARCIHDDEKWIWRELAEIGETPRHLGLEK